MKEEEEEEKEEKEKEEEEGEGTETSSQATDAEPRSQAGPQSFHCVDSRQRNWS